MATNSCAVRTSPVWGSITSIVCPAQSTNNRSPAGWRWRITGDSFAFPPRLKLAKPGIAVALRVIGAILLPTATTASRPCGATRGGHARSQSGSHDLKHHALSAEKSAAQGRCQTCLAAAARPPQRPERDPDNPEAWCAQSLGLPRSVGSTYPPLTVVKRLGSYA